MASPNPEGNSGSLNGVKVVDLVRALSGHDGAMIPADMGAETITVEEPPKGKNDPTSN